eukprot:3535089-Rhodomonas_salina.2
MHTPGTHSVPGNPTRDAAGFSEFGPCNTSASTATAAATKIWQSAQYPGARVLQFVFRISVAISPVRMAQTVI